MVKKGQPNPGVVRTYLVVNFSHSWPPAASVVSRKMDLDTDLVSAVKAARDESSSMALDDDAAAEHLELSHSTSIEPGLVLVLGTLACPNTF